jgi:hypothetical protein
VFVLVISKVIMIQIYKYLVNKYQAPEKTTNQSAKPPSFLQTPKVSSNHILGALVEEQRLVQLETETTREVQVVARQSGKIGVGVVVVDAAVVEALDIVVVDIA